MSPEAPVVDVVIPVRNGESTVLRAIDSVLNQTFGRFRLYVVDDGSTDRTAELVAQVEDPRVTLTTIEHGGVSAARNVGAAMGSAPMIAFLDADDEVLPRWLEEMTRDPDALLVRCASLRCVEGKPTETVDPETGPLLAGTFVVARSLFESIGGYDERLAYSENTDLGMRLGVGLVALGAETRFVPTPAMRRFVDGRLRAERYGSVTLRDSAEHMLRKHSSTLTREATASFSAVAGVNSLLLGERRRARRHLWAALRRTPSRWRYAIRYLQTWLPGNRKSVLLERKQQSAPASKGSIARNSRWWLYREYRIARMRRRVRGTVEAPVLIYQMGKVGSTSVAAALRSSPLNRPVIQVHFLSTRSLRAGDHFYRSRYALRGGCPNAHILGHLLHRRLRSNSLGRDLRTVSIVRDPVAVNVSSFFQTLEWTHPQLAVQLKREPANPDVLHEVLGALQRDAWMENPHVWFRIELVEVLGIAVFERPFPVDTGYDVVEGSLASSLILRYEDLDRTFTDAMRDFFGLYNCEIVSKNDSSSKYYADAYALALRKYRPTDEQIDHLYGSPITRHFYTEKEIAAFRARWSRCDARTTFG